MQEWERRPAVGWLCSYTPVELLAAAGFRPARLAGGAGHEARARAVLPAALCPYLKNCLGAALSGAAGPLAGLVVATGCDGLRRLADVWRRYGGGAVCVLDVPRHRDGPAVAYFRSQLLALAEGLARVSGQPIAGEALWAAIDGHNRTRRLLAELDRRRQQGEAPPARDVLAIVDRSAAEPPEAFNRWLEAWLAERGPGKRAAARTPVVLAGNLLAAGDRAVADLIEEAGGQVVGDDLCNGMRGVAGEVAAGADPLLALARRYLERVPCPRMEGAEERYDELLELCRRAGARGVVYVSQKYCDASLYDLAPLRERLEGQGVRVLLLELDANATLLGQAQTRIEAFLEVL